MATFAPPTQNVWLLGEGSPPQDRRFWNHFGPQPRGRSVLKTGGVWATVDNPTQEQIAAADLITDPLGYKVPGVFLGGHVAEVTATVATELTSAGYAAYLT